MNKIYFSQLSDPEEFPDIKYLPWNQVYILDQDYEAWMDMRKEQNKALYDAMNLGTGFMKMPYNIGCDHKWKFYQGFSETYSYCEKCDEKKI
jgi:hypothetical protein